MDLKQFPHPGALKSLNLSEFPSKRHQVPSIFIIELIPLLFTMPATKAIGKDFKV
jgi:hypothetical protein